jgi:hypothetical protein
MWRASPRHQLNILFFYLFIYKLALPTASAAVTSIYPNLPASMMPYDIRAQHRSANKQSQPSQAALAPPATPPFGGPKGCVAGERHPFAAEQE